MKNPCSPVRFELLIQKRTLNVIYQKFSTKSFTLQDAVTQLFWLGSIEKHIQYMEQHGWITLDKEKQFHFVKSPDEWSGEQ